MKNSHALIIAGAILMAGLVNAWVISGIAPSVQNKHIPTASSYLPPPALAMLPGNRIVAATYNHIFVYRIDDKGNAVLENATKTNR